MADESFADDGAIYDVWDLFTPAEVAAYFARLDRLHRAFVRLRDADPSPELVAEAHALSDTLLSLRHLPALRAVLAQGIAL